ncbi:MAG: T9SS type B sorting domain-containing protein [Flavobacteriaceae bacterium]|nr:T9SS type B sorting domain-containing protein [Flavobacteriaceae bacterium]
MLPWLAVAQKETNSWYFGENAGLDFNSGTPMALSNGALNTREGCAAISDKNGNLLFYTDGVTVYNKNHGVMLNGTGLKGHSSSTHSAIIVPKPANTAIYYILTADELAGVNGLQYTEVDMSLDGGLGGVTSNKNKLLLSQATEKITAIKSSIAEEYWVISHKWNSNEFVAYKISGSGVHPGPVISAVGSYIGGTETTKAIGSIKMAPDGTKLAVANGRGLAEVQLFDFDAATGIVSNPSTLMDLDNETYQTPYGIEFSPNSKVLYVSVHNEGIYQYNLEAGSETAIVNSKQKINAEVKVYGALQLATNGKIYVAVEHSTFLDVINKPNELGVGAAYQNNGVELGGKRARLGLPPFIQSYFNISIQVENLCFGNPTSFSLLDTVDSVTWDFGDPDTGLNNTATILSPTHLFSKPGSFEVTATAKVGTETATTIVKVIIYEQPQASTPNDISICDTDNDGYYTVDLTAQSAAILNSQNPAVFNIKYYTGLANFNSGIAISNATAYTNRAAYTKETIYAKVYNKNNEACYALTSFSLQVDENPMPGTNSTPLKLCENNSVGSDTDGKVLINLTVKENELLNGQSAAVFDLTYYTDLAYTNRITNPTAYPNIKSPQTIYVKMTNKGNNSCSAFTNFDIEVTKLPVVASSVVLKQCDDNIDGFSAFNLTEANTKISSNANNETITFFTSYAAADSNDSSEKILTPTAYMNQKVSVDKVWARVENPEGCHRVSELNLVVATTAIPANFQHVFYKCDDYIDSINNEKDGVATFDFSSVTQEIERIFPEGQQVIITYYSNEADALAEENPIGNTSNYRNIGFPYSQQIYIRVDSKLNNDCLGLGAHITLKVEPIPIANPVKIERKCDDDFDGLYPFDTSAIESSVLNGQTGMIVSYMDKNGNPLPSPLPNPFLTSTQTIRVRVTDNTSNDVAGACFAETFLDFVVDKMPVANSIINLVACDDDFDGKYPFDTSTIETSVLNGQTAMLVSYIDENGINLPSPLPNPFLTTSQTVTVIVENKLNNNCVAETSFDFIVNQKPDFELVDTEILCLNKIPKKLSIVNPKEADYSYRWTDENNIEISKNAEALIYKGGIYTVTATSQYACVSFPKQIIVTESNIASISVNQIEIKDDSSSNSIAIETLNLGIGDYEYAIQKDNEPILSYQDNPLFENVSPGIYTVYVNDKNNCGTEKIEVSVIGYPNFFTPNNDGYNDYWNVIGVNNQFYPNSLIHIYDRYGKIVAKINPGSIGWDGYFKGSPLPASDFWFSVLLIDSNGNTKEKRGHFSLIR